MFEEYEELVNLARLGLAGRRQDVALYVTRIARRLREAKPEVADRLNALLAESPTRDAPLRNSAVAALPVDKDSRLKLARPEYPVVLDVEPIWSEAVGRALDQIRSERLHEEELLTEGLFPTKSMLFTGPPGVGKSLAARWLAAMLDLPLLTLDLSAVMSSFLGRTGANVRHVLDYAKGTRCIFLLDEVDAIAKSRADTTEIGELKRLVTVLLQEIDDWPPSGILIAATNHPSLLDPAVWRRFDAIVSFPMPSPADVRQFMSQLLDGNGLTETFSRVASLAMYGQSFSDIRRDVHRARRQCILAHKPIEDCLRQTVSDRLRSKPAAERKRAALSMVGAGVSNRQASEWTGVHRDTIARAIKTHDG